MKAHGVTSVALRETRVAELSADLFPELQANAPTVLQTLVHEMLDRTQEYTRMGAQREKLISLGTMSAGLAHELNNPASAAKRAAQNLQETLQAFDIHSSRIMIPVIFKPRADDGDPFRPLNNAMTLGGDDLSPLVRSDREDELGEWLAEQGVENAWDAAATLVTGGLDKAVMLKIADALVPEQVHNFLEWVPKDVEMRLLTKELMESTTRISSLVGAMKAYSYMDQGLDKQEIDLREGIVNTLIILKHKWKKKDVHIVKKFEDVPKISAYGSELNQVWTNLIANAVDAVAEGGTITIQVGHDRLSNVACVDVIDDGPGVPEEIQSRIFEPFFTTKGVGEGTGMGLDIANRIVRQRHMGTLQLESRPWPHALQGETAARVAFPNHISCEKTDTTSLSPAGLGETPWTQVRSRKT
jgi:signal transduction histidine kinase